MEIVKSFVILISLLGVEISESTQIKIFYVLPDNSTNISCPSQPCTTLSQYLLDNNNTLPAVSNVEYHFLPGKHDVPANLMLQNLYNFSIVGVISKSSSFPVLIGRLHLYVLKIYNSHYVTIRNIEFEHHYKQQLQHISGLHIFQCFSCILDNLILGSFGIIARNLIGNSYLNEIDITHTKGLLCQGITLQYWDDDQLLNDYNEYYLLINKLKITGNRNGSRCYNFNSIYSTGVYVHVTRTTKNSTITINNSFFMETFHTAIDVINLCAAKKNSLLINNCTFYSNIWTYGPLLKVSLSKDNKIVSVKNCTIYNNYGNPFVVYIRIMETTDFMCKLIKIKHKYTFSTSIYFKESNFTFNHGDLLKVEGQVNKVELFIIGPFYITRNGNTNWGDLHTHVGSDLISFEKLTVNIFGPLFISHNFLGSHGSILSFKSSQVTFYGTITFRSNTYGQVITLMSQYTYIKVMEYSNVTFIQNQCKNKLIDVIQVVNDVILNFCLFQYMSYNKSSTAMPSNYAINIINTSSPQRQECSFIYYYFTPTCKWLPDAALQEFDSQTAKNEIIKIDGTKKLNYHRICICYSNGSFDCSISILGTVYPGQLLQVTLCTPCRGRPSVLYTEMHKSLLTNLSCRITNQAETLSIISNYEQLW